ncbi:Hypothetical predicted protein [Lecanosticta acicola]|uniref:Uncharacterized protein n=1 Tax=Lecanosticta acicola TaxID=111012 RepID=A0AAI8Z636_9PEZI|nr:Hypothetical predicted protein [Lecanosticta acicola]
MSTTLKMPPNAYISQLPSEANAAMPLPLPKLTVALLVCDPVRKKVLTVVPTSEGNEFEGAQGWLPQTSIREEPLTHTIVEELLYRWTAFSSSSQFKIHREMFLRVERHLAEAQEVRLFFRVEIQDAEVTRYAMRPSKRVRVHLDTDPKQACALSWVGDWKDCAGEENQEAVRRALLAMGALGVSKRKGAELEDALMGARSAKWREARARAASLRFRG